MGNINSVVRRLEFLGAQVRVARTYDEIMRSEKLVLPGVGHFAAAMEFIKKNSFDQALHKVVISDKIPILGICLGMQLMMRFSEEGNVHGLNWFDADVHRFKISDTKRFKVPQVGWNSADFCLDTPLNKGLNNDMEFYFVHSYCVTDTSFGQVLSTTNYEYTFVSAVRRDNIYGVQFHPEKSHDAGDAILLNFILI
jgi:glutamine amidotransferase